MCPKTFCILVYLLVDEADATSGTGRLCVITVSSVPPSRVVWRPVGGGPVGGPLGLWSVGAPTAAAAPWPATTTAAVVTALGAVIGAVPLSAAAAPVTVRLSGFSAPGAVTTIPLRAVAPIAIDLFGKKVVKANQSRVDVRGARLGVGGLPLEPAPLPVAVEQATGKVGCDGAGRGSDERVDARVASREESSVDVAVAAVVAAPATRHVDPLTSGIDVDLG